MASLNEKAWQKYIRQKNFLFDGSVLRVSADELKDITKREPRLLAKIDEPKDMPQILLEHNYAILAIKNGEYIIFKGNIFQEVGHTDSERKYDSQAHFKLFTSGRGISEDQYLDNAFNTGIIGDFVNCGELYLTIRGRERTGQFQFGFKNSDKQFTVDGVQIEVDAGYEGENDILIVEAKIGNRSHFNVRQLYYPYRHFSSLVPSKKVRPIFFTYDLHDGTYNLYEYKFSNPLLFDSLAQINAITYQLVEKKPRTIDSLIDDKLYSENNIVPQADDINKILELLTVINSGENSYRQIAEYFNFEPRQSNYYSEAAEFLGLITRKDSLVEMTSNGQSFISNPPEAQQLMMGKFIINSWVFRKLLKIASKKGYFDNNDVDNVICEAQTADKEQRYTASTITRRRQTILSWLRWIAEQFKCLSFQGGKWTVS